MKKSKLIILPIVVLICLIFALSGCGGEETPIPDNGGDDGTQTSEEMLISIDDGALFVVFELNNSSAAKSLYSQLPITTTLSDYGNNEKIFYPTEKLDTGNVTGAQGPAGTLAYFSPWGNVVMYYGSFGAYNGLYALGEAVSGAENIKNLSGTIMVSAK